MLVSGCDPGGREVESLPARHFSVRSLFFSPIANAELWKLVSLCRDDHLPRVRRYLGPLIMLPMPEAVCVGADDIYRKLRKQGTTIQKTNDCIIAATALEHHCQLLHNDKDSVCVANHYPLKMVNS